MDHWVALLLAPLAFWIVLSGLDDCVIDVAAALAWLRTWREGEIGDDDLASVPPMHIAVFVAAWKEHRVIQRMLDNNLARLRYRQADFFVGAYPNDPATVSAVRETMKRHPNVHLALCPHDGPTSKADCLNWIYQRMLVFEEEQAVSFGMIVTHDAEDVIDPDALQWLNYYGREYDMVQIPVLALATPLGEITHGVYCDEFCESQHKDMMARAILGGFIPSTGVGTGFSRRALELLAERHSNRIFEPACLTEDYENGFRVSNFGLRQKFVPIRVRDGRAVATREYFPREFAGAVRQRARWITGICFQSWEFHSFGETARNLYWFWRDRKSVGWKYCWAADEFVFLYGIVTLTWAASTRRTWGLEHEIAWFWWETAAALGLQIFHTAIRMGCCARVYGWRFAAGVPVRIVAANWINCFACCRAISTYAAAKLRREPLRWVKTEHAYPNRAALVTKRKRLGEILVGGDWVTEEQLGVALATKPSSRRLGEHLRAMGLITEVDLYTALALQNDLPIGKPEPSSVSVAVTRTLPAALAKKWCVLPFRIAAGELYLAGAEIPGEQMQEEIRQFSSLGIRFRLVTPTDFEELAAQYLP